MVGVGRGGWMDGIPRIMGFNCTSFHVENSHVLTLSILVTQKRIRMQLGLPNLDAGKDEDGFRPRNNAQSAMYYVKRDDDL